MKESSKKYDIFEIKDVSSFNSDLSNKLELLEKASLFEKREIIDKILVEEKKNKSTL